MALEQVFETQILIGTKYVEKLMNELHLSGIVEVNPKTVNKTEKIETLNSLSSLSNLLQELISGLKGYTEADKRSLFSKIFHEIKISKEHVLGHDQADFIRENTQYALDLQKKLSDCKAKLDQINTEITEVHHDLDLSEKLPAVNLETLTSSEQMIITVGVIKLENKEKLLQIHPSDGILLTRINQSDLGFISILTQNQAESVEWSGFMYQDLQAYKYFEGISSKTIQQAIQIKATHLDTVRTQIINSLKVMAQDHFKRLQALNEETKNKYEKQRAVFDFLDEKTYTSINVWCPIKNLGKLENTIKKITEHYYVISQDSEEAPIIYKNIGPIKHFQTITNLYSPPKSGHYDPTWIIAITFSVFFAFMLTDFFYGLAILVFAMFMYWGVGRINPGLRSFAGVLMVMASFTIIVGIIFGSYFGDFFVSKELDTGILSGLAMSFRSITEHYALINSLTDIIPMLSVVIVLGLIHLSTGYVVGFVENLSKKKYVDALSGQGVWILFVAALVLSVLSMVLKEQTSNLLIASGVLAGSSMILQMVTKFKDGGPIYAMLSLSNYSGFFGDLFSYARLMALAIGTSGIALAVNFMAFMLLGIPKVGIILAILMFIVGHLFNLLVNGLGSFIHTTRLHFLEFFSKFYEGGGRIYRPFKALREFSEVET